MSSGVNVIHGTCRCTKWHWGHGARLSSREIEGTWVRKDSKSASTSQSASRVSFERQSSSCRIIRDGILVSCANMSKRKGVLSPWEEFFFQGFVESDLLLLLFVQRQSWCRSLDRCTISRCCWLLCFIGDLVVLSQVLFFRPGAYWLRSCGLCHEGKLLLRTAKRNYHYHVTILCKGDDIASFAFELELTRLPLLIYDYAWMYQHDLSRFGG